MWSRVRRIRWCRKGWGTVPLCTLRFWTSGGVERPWKHKQRNGYTVQKLRCIFGKPLKKGVPYASGRPEASKEGGYCTPPLSTPDCSPRLMRAVLSKSFALACVVRCVRWVVILHVLVVVNITSYVDTDRFTTACKFGRFSMRRFAERQNNHPMRCQCRCLC